MLAGFFTDGDLRRLLGEGQQALKLENEIHTVMNDKPTAVLASKMAAEAARILSSDAVPDLEAICLDNFCCWISSQNAKLLSID